MVVPEKPFWTFREIIGGVIALLIVGSLVYSSTVDGSAAAQTAIVGGAGAVTGWLFRPSNQPPTNGNGYTNSSNGSSGGTTSATP